MDETLFIQGHHVNETLNSRSDEPSNNRTLSFGSGPDIEAESNFERNEGKSRLAGDKAELKDAFRLAALLSHFTSIIRRDTISESVSETPRALQ